MPNGFDRPQPFPAEARAPGALRLVYLGTLNPWQGILWSLKAIRDLPYDISLDMYGGYSKTLRRFAAKRICRYNLSAKVRILDPLSRNELDKVLPQYDLGFAPLLKTDRNTLQGCCPVKVLDYIGRSLPVLASDLSVIREILPSAAGLVTFVPNSLRSLRQALAELCSQPGRVERLKRGCLEAQKRMWTWEDYGERLCSIYETMASSGSALPRTQGSAGAPLQH